MLLHQIFYPQNKFDGIIHKLEPWMLIDEYRVDREETVSVSATATTTNSDTDIRVMEGPTMPGLRVKVHKSWWTPKKEDTLFWCTYVLHHGIEEYAIIGTRYKNVEIEEKQRILDYIRTHTAECKQSGSKITNVSIQEIQSDLMINKKTSWMTFWMMCVFYKIHALILYEHTWMECKPHCNDPSPPVYKFSRSRDGHMSVNTTPLTVQEVADIRANGLQVDYFRSPHPIRAMSNYKVDELLAMAAILGLTADEVIKHAPAGQTKLKKVDWYNAILEKCKW